MPIKLKDLIARVSPECKAEVGRVRNQVQPVVRQALRSECRLVFRTAEDSEHKGSGAQVPVEIAPGYPVILEAIEFPDDFERIMLLGQYRLSLEQVQNGTKQLLKLHDALSRLPEPNKWAPVKASDLQSVATWAAYLLEILDEHDPLKKVLSVSEDILGAYKYDARDLFADDQSVNRASIELYWGIIGLVSEWLGCDLKDLAIVVLTHELAHAYTQLGADLEGRRWAAPSFSKAETSLKEGLAQYYTERVLRRLEWRHGGALGVYLSLLPRQHEVYRTHQPWVEESSTEAVRRAMLEVRRWNEGKLADFNRRLKTAQEALNPQVR